MYIFIFTYTYLIWKFCRHYYIIEGWLLSIRMKPSRCEIIVFYHRPERPSVYIDHIIGRFIQVSIFRFSCSQFDNTYVYMRKRTRSSSVYILVVGTQQRNVYSLIALEWRHNEHDGGWNHQPHDCLLNRLFRRKSKKTSKPCVTGFLWGEFTGDRWIPRTKGQ